MAVTGSKDFQTTKVQVLWPLYELIKSQTEIIVELVITGFSKNDLSLETKFQVNCRKYSTHLRICVMSKITEARCVQPWSLRATVLLVSLVLPTADYLVQVCSANLKL